MKKPIIIGTFALLYILVTFFGIGPVLLADGSMQERVITLVIIIIIYVLLTFGLKKLLKSIKD
ncbi:MAG: hypothetical protein APF76_11935 [Desulfitibacter sp. BRH_c19]|nr:MAG: hypothetical protein APF76_11935 [Desulfitibacter sp. BRH_c19]